MFQGRRVLSNAMMHSYICITYRGESVLCIVSLTVCKHSYCELMVYRDHVRIYQEPIYVFGSESVGIWSSILYQCSITLLMLRVMGHNRVQSPH